MHTKPLKYVFCDPFGKAGVTILTGIILIAIFAPSITESSPYDYSGTIFSAPSSDHLLGTDSMGQDIWARLLFGARTSLFVAACVAALSSVLSVLIGSTAALFGGLYDRFCMRVIDAFLSLPAIIVTILFAAYFQPGLIQLIILVSVFTWPGGARIIRSSVLSLKEKNYVCASRTFGANTGHILINHIIPDLFPIIAARMIQDARRAVFMEAGLAFLGVSDPNLISWGKIMHQALGFVYLDVWKWWLFPAGLALSLTLLGLGFLGYSLETILNPKIANETMERARQC